MGQGEDGSGVTKRFLVAGGAGFIGSAECEIRPAMRYWSWTSSHKLVISIRWRRLRSILGFVSSRRTSATSRGCKPSYRSSVCAGRDHELGGREPRGPIDRWSRRVCPDQRGGHIRTPAGGSGLLARALTPGSRGVPLPHHVSTDEVFGSLGPEERPFREESRYQPNSPYAASKAASDHLVRAWHETYGLPTLVTNCSNNSGPYHFPEKLIPLVTLNALEGKPLPVYGQRFNVRDWL